MERSSGLTRIAKTYQVARDWASGGSSAYASVGTASWYGPRFHGRATANGEIFDRTALTAAHPTLPLPSYVRVTNLDNDRSVVLRVNDRGPYVRRRLIDVSERAAEILQFKRSGMAPVRVEYVGRAPDSPADQPDLMASYRGPSTLPTAGQPLRSAPSPAATPVAKPRSTAPHIRLAAGKVDGQAEGELAAAIDSREGAPAPDAADRRILMAFQTAGVFSR